MEIKIFGLLCLVFSPRQLILSCFEAHWGEVLARGSQLLWERRRAEQRWGYSVPNFEPAREEIKFSTHSLQLEMVSYDNAKTEPLFVVGTGSEIVRGSAEEHTCKYNL